MGATQLVSLHCSLCHDTYRHGRHLRRPDIEDNSYCEEFREEEGPGGVGCTREAAAGKSVG